MAETAAGPLVLGGHSYIQQLGNEPKPTVSEQRALVAKCLDEGITWFDTTYMPERTALGKALKDLDRSNEAFILAWNFFQEFDDEGSVGKASRYVPEHIDRMLGELQTDYIDCLVVHSVANKDENRIQEKLAKSWLAEGLVRRLGIWSPDPDQEHSLSKENPYSLMVKPYNIDTPSSGDAFAMGKRLGWTTLACSPFARGWRLDEIVRCEANRIGVKADEAGIRSEVSDLMLRYSLFHDSVDRLIVSMRRLEWVSRNIASYSKGKLSAKEEERLLNLAHEN
jgi:aryl-alcohol dehydrogenase-like predicted oxidoreductase